MRNETWKVDGSLVRHVQGYHAYRYHGFAAQFVSSRKFFFCLFLGSYFALVSQIACWPFWVTVVSDSMMFSNGSTSGSVDLTAANTASLTALVNYPKITTVALFPPAVSSAVMVTGLLSTVVKVVLCFGFGFSSNSVGSPGASHLAITGSSQNLITDAFI